MLYMYKESADGLDITGSLARVKAFLVHDAFGTWGCTTSVHGDFGTYNDYFGT